MARYANVVSTLALIFALGSGGAYAVATITGADVVDGSLHTVDLGNNAVTSTKVKDDAMTGADIDESTLGEVPAAVDAATVGGVPVSGIGTGRSILRATECDPTSATLQNCAELDVDLPRPGRVLVIVDGQWYAHSAAETRATCRLRVDTSIQGDEVAIGQLAPGTFSAGATDLQHQQSFQLSEIDHIVPGGPVLPAGTHSFSLLCGVLSGDPRIDHVNISAVLLGSD